MKLTGWWSRRSNPEKVELYTRWSFHAFVLIEVGAIGLRALSGAPQPLGGWLMLLSCAHAVLGGVVSSRALDWNTGRRERPYRLIAAHGALSVAVAAGGLLMRRFGALEDVGTAGAVVVGALGFGICSVVLCMVKVRHMLYLVLATGAGVALFCLALGMTRQEVLGFTVGQVIMGVLLAFTSGFSGWLLRAVWELDAARELQARLAVAEERLRFGRDLHDVMGRNLSVIALKSELAVQLARRGRAEAAVDQMAEVQRIARESQREVREVVRGYREADLHTELEGARSVLAAAGIACTVESADAPLPARVQSALAWVVREGTTNVLRHGDARRCSVSLTVTAGAEEEGYAVLVVENDGVDGGPGTGTGRSGMGRFGPGTGSGAGSADGPGGGSGLAGLRERLAALDGTLEARRVSGGRFRVTARVPVGARVPEEAGVPGGTRPAVGARVPGKAGAVEEARVPEETR
ncbi:sensor histidine kinase [Streptomyces sp. NPDC057116]|uniref:sensor histidine kinase n=1 Tax=Streptomyces sp. NPDC057116 TaxID=3346023 RepID=UPI00363BC08A